VIASVSARETGRRVAVRTTVDICSFVDRLAVDDVGELLVVADGTTNAPSVRGAVFVESGRVCWAAARGLAPRLTQLLMEPSGLDAAGMEDIYRRCKLERAPIGEFLVARGIVRPDDLRAALLQHTTESLDVLCDERTVASWWPRPGGYNARFTFKTSELLAHWFAHRHGSTRERLGQTLDTFSSSVPGEWGALFVRVPSVAAPLPLIVRGALPEKSFSVLRVGKWAASALDVAATFQSEDVLVTAMESGGTTLVAWRHEDGIVAGRMTANGPARLLHQRATMRRAIQSASTCRTET